MQMLYDSESFVVVHMLPDAVETSTQALNDTAPPRPNWRATALKSWTSARAKRCTWMAPGPRCSSSKILAWQRDTPTQEEVEDAGPVRWPGTKPWWWFIESP